MAAKTKIMERAKISLNNATIGKNFRYFTPGFYIVRVESCKVVETRKNTELFVCETTILESEGDEAQRLGRCSWTVDLGIDAAAGNIKELMVSIAGIDPQDESAIEDSGEDWDAYYATAVAPDNPTKGTLLELSAAMQTTQKGGQFCRVHFAPHVE